MTILAVTILAVTILAVTILAVTILWEGSSLRRRAQGEPPVRHGYVVSHWYSLTTLMQCLPSFLGLGPLEWY